MNCKKVIHPISRVSVVWCSRSAFSWRVNSFFPTTSLFLAGPGFYNTLDEREESFTITLLFFCFVNDKSIEQTDLKQICDKFLCPLV